MRELSTSSSTPLIERCGVAAAAVLWLSRFETISRAWTGLRFAATSSSYDDSPSRAIEV